MDDGDRVALDGVAMPYDFFSPSVNGTGSGAANGLAVAKEEEYELELIAEVAFELAPKEEGAEIDSKAETFCSSRFDKEA